MSDRDLNLLILLFPVLAAFVYWHTWLKPVRRETAGLAAEVRGLGNEQQLIARGEQLRAAQSRLREQVAALPPEPDASTPAVVSSEVRAPKLQRLHDLFHSSGIRLVSAAEEEKASANDVNVENSVAHALSQLGAANPRRWNVTVEAPYDAILSLLETCCTNTNALVVTESLALKAGSGDGKPTYWTLTLCL